MTRTLIASVALGLSFLPNALRAAPSDAQLLVQDESGQAAEASAPGVAFYVIPVEGPIDKPTLYAIRTGVKEAIAGEFDYVVLDMKTPGGRLDVTLEIMEILDRFPGQTLTYVNDEATSAGAIIAATTQEIYFSPKGTMGSAEVVGGDGKDIDESMKRKITSFLNAKLDAYTAEYPFRSEVIRAMMDPNFEFKIGDRVISPEGELLNLNALRAHEEYGDPPRPLLGSGIVESLDALLESLALGRSSAVTRFEPTWSLELAQFIVGLAPILMAIAMLSVYYELQSPGFGVFGIVGVSCFLVAIFGHHVAGLSGQEPLLLFALGVALVGLELFLMPGALVLAIPGMLLMIGSLLWSMADIWPSNTPDFEWTFGMFEGPLQTFMTGILLGVAAIALLARFMPKSPLWSRMVLTRAIVGNAGGPAAAPGQRQPPAVGAEGVACTDLLPSGEIELGGRRFEARLTHGSLARGARVRVVRKTDFGYEVEEAQP